MNLIPIKANMNEVKLTDRNGVTCQKPQEFFDKLA